MLMGLFESSIIISGNAGTTWNPLDQNVDILLTNGNLTAANNGAGVTSVRSVKTITSNQKAYFEVTVNVQGTGNYMGFAKSTLSLSSTSPGTETPSLSFIVQSNTGFFECFDSANHNTQMFGGASAGDVISIAFDSLNSKAWFRKNGGNWNNDVIGNQNPATNTGGVAIPFAGPYFALATPVHFLDKQTAAFSSVSWAFTVPSGFSQIDA